MLKLSIIGNLGADAEAKVFNGEKFVSFRVAHTSRYTDKETGAITETTQWVSVTMNGDGGGLLQYLKKGTKIFAWGDCSTRIFIGHDGQRHSGLNLRVQSIELCGGARDADPMEIVQRLATDADYNARYMAAYEEYMKLHPNTDKNG